MAVGGAAGAEAEAVAGAAVEDARTVWLCDPVMLEIDACNKVKLHAASRVRSSWGTCRAKDAEGALNS